MKDKVIDVANVVYDAGLVIGGLIFCGVILILIGQLVFTVIAFLLGIGEVVNGT